ncbi:type a von Willebrand factor domain-containing protein [Plakobranchus ocellatus]|uniref:Type a von Willebrand factor domain-containing protein n=1 Tax=Plakobranchus ocellatus TaxID=259542 RepID=A0AAV4A9N3_9GAST|nr:type a von Willebrand factor domain-containing protein [Plakobranchus ocellatus]
MLSPPTQILKSEKGATANEQNRATPGTIVYCIDMSSSMNRTYKMPASQAAWQTVKTSGDQKYVSKLTRLDCIKKAVTRLIEQLKLEKPEQKVLLAVFASDVTVKAGGANHMTPSFDNLEHQTMAELLDKGLNSASSYPLVPIEESYESIVAAVKALIAREGNGKRSTALGPALSLCVGFLRKVPNSQVVLCTDGLPNVGIGSLNDIIRISRNMFERGADFYRQIGTYACNKNITINILAVDGPSVEMRSISEAATLTGGTTNKINPAEIVRELRIIAQKEVVANSVSVTFYLHPNFVFDEPDFGDNLSRLEKEVGSVKKETDMTFRFKLKDPSKAEDIDSVPFQIQIIYTRNDGMKCMRVLSKRAGATRNRATMEQYVNVAVVGVAAMRTTANLAKVGKGKEAQEYMKLVKRLVKRGSNTSEQLEERLAFEAQAESWDKELTDNNEVYCTSHLTDLSSKMVQQAMSSNMIQHLAMGKKIDVVTNRKMNAAAKKAYYNYTYDL